MKPQDSFDVRAHMSHLQNGTWYHLDVHAPPYFISKPEEIVYVSLGDSIILHCLVREPFAAGRS